MKERRPINAWFVIIFVQDQLEAHINVVYERKKPHKCSFCEYSFKTEGNLIQFKKDSIIMDSLIMDLLIMELIDYLFQHFEHSGKSKTNIWIILTVHI